MPACFRGSHDSAGTPCIHHGSQKHGTRRVLVSSEASLLRRLDVYAEKDGLTRSALIARGLELLLAKDADSERAK
jgi:hypothetical protein